MATKILTNDIRAVIADALDGLYANTDDGGLGKTCRLVYPPTKSAPCPNCVFDPVGGRSRNIYRTGGPAPFTTGACPLCSGRGYEQTETFEDVTLLCNWEPRRFTVPVKNIDLRVPFSLVETKGFIDPVLEKVLKADHMILQLPLANILRKKFKLRGQPGDSSNIVQGRYFFALWEQVVA